jgi:hypothetical protein
VTLGNGSVVSNHLSTGTVRLGAEAKSGTILLDETSADILVGLAFLRTFRKSLILTNEAIVLTMSMRR